MDSLIFKCDRCAEYFTGDSYRVTSEADGVILLEMVVCYGCCLAAAKLGLDTQVAEIRRYAVR
jgi:hypothetical protein